MYIDLTGSTKRVTESIQPSSFNVPLLDLMVLTARDGLCESLSRRATEAVAPCHSPDDFVELCRVHKCYSTVLHSLKHIDKEVNPCFLDPVRTQLAGLLYGKWVPLRMKLLHIMDDMRSIFNTNEIPFAFIKGIRFAELFYTHPERRICSDVDVLVAFEFREQAIEALLDTHFEVCHSEMEDKARRDFEGKMELRHRKTGIVTDLCWRLTGNGGIGEVDSDLAVLWQHAVHVNASEYDLSPEDCLLNLIRHLSHGHQFEHGLLQACVDTSQLLGKCPEIRWDYVVKGATQTELLRVFRFYSDFYNAYYRDETMPALGETVEAFRAVAHPQESMLFSSLLKRMMNTQTWRGIPWRDVCFYNLRAVGWLWSVDRLGRLARMLVTTVFPKTDVVVLFTLHMKSSSMLVRRICYYFYPFLPVVPGIAIGACLRILATVGIKKSPHSFQN